MPLTRIGISAAVPPAPGTIHTSVPVAASNPCRPPKTHMSLPPASAAAALAAINTAYNQVSSDISLAQASADQKIVQSKRAVEIETLNAQAEVEPLKALAAQLTELGKAGQADSIEIRWPRGAVQKLADVAADRFLKVEENAQK